MGNKPFSNVGVDYFGPVIVKISKQIRSNAAKANQLGVIFTCFNTRAVHLKLVRDMATNLFLLSLRRFISRRVEVRVIRSDNSTNFAGAERKVKSCIRNLDQNKTNSFRLFTEESLYTFFCEIESLPKF